MSVGEDEMMGEPPQIRTAGLYLIAFFWVVQFAELSVVSLAEGGEKALRLFEPRLIVLGTGLLMTIAIVEVVARSTHQPFRKQLLRTFAAALLTCALLTTVNYSVFSFGFHADDGAPFDPVEFTYTAFSWSWFFFSVAAALLALQYSFDVRAREREMASLRGIAADAQLAALRYQLNPHFLFNTLNSIAALIGDKRFPEAESMVENLADFLRATLELDPNEDITLVREVELQQLYLAVEQVRFPDRLRVIAQIDSAVGQALVPSLLLQPIVENGVRHAVARSQDPVTLTLSACRDRDRLHIEIDDDGRPTGRAAKRGTGVGVLNVRARLRGLFADDQMLNSGPQPGGGYRTVIELPLRFSSDS